VNPPEANRGGSQLRVAGYGSCDLVHPGAVDVQGPPGVTLRVGLEMAGSCDARSTSSRAWWRASWSSTASLGSQVSARLSSRSSPDRLLRFPVPSRHPVPSATLTAPLAGRVIPRAVAPIGADPLSDRARASGPLSSRKSHVERPGVARSKRSLLAVIPRFMPHRESKARPTCRRGGSAGRRTPRSAVRRPIDDLILVVVIRILIGQVRVFATHKPHTQHDSCHARKVARLPHSPRSRVRIKGASNRRVRQHVLRGVAQHIAHQQRGPLLWR
jgi:hypothetical protein